MPRVIPDAPVTIYPPQRPPAEPNVFEGQARRFNAAIDVAADVGDPYHIQRGALSPDEAQALTRGMVVPSFWRDYILVETAEELSRQALESPVLRGRYEGDPDHPERDTDLPNARYRLEQARKGTAFDQEWRDISGSGTSFLPTVGAVPGYIAEAFATSARSLAPLTEYLISRPHPGSLTITTPRIVSGAAVNVQTAENAAVQETDPTSALQQVPTATIAGQLDLSAQLYEFSNPDADTWVSAELGADYAAKLEVQVISGSGSSGQTTGFRNVSGQTAVTHTNATPTAATNYAKIGDLIQQTAVASGIRPDTLVLAPRRREFIESKLGWVPTWFGLTVIESPSMPLTLGAGTNQDPVIVFPRNEVFLYERPIRFAVYPQVGSSTLTVRLSALGYAALLANRKPTAIGVSTGTEWVAPTF